MGNRRQSMPIGCKTAFSIGAVKKGGAGADSRNDQHSTAPADGGQPRLNLLLRMRIKG